MKFTFPCPYENEPWFPSLSARMEEEDPAWGAFIAWQNLEPLIESLAGKPDKEVQYEATVQASMALQDTVINRGATTALGLIAQLEVGAAVEFDAVNGPITEATERTIIYRAVHAVVAALWKQVPELVTDADRRAAA